MSNLDKFLAWARTNNKGNSITSAQDWCDRVNLAALSATVAEREEVTQEETLTSLQEWASTSALWASLGGNY